MPELAGSLEVPPVNLQVRSQCGFCGEDGWLNELPLFRLYADGLVLFRSSEADGSFAPYRYAILPSEQRDELLRHALDDGGLRAAKTYYPGDGDDAGSTTFAINARYVDEAADKTVVFSPKSADPVDDREIRERLERLAATLLDFDVWLRERGLESHLFEPLAYTAAMIWTTEGETREPWPWDDLKPSDFADTYRFGPTLARLTPAQARQVSATPGGGRVGSLASSPGKVSEAYVQPVLPGDDVPGAFGLRPDTVAVAVTDRLRVRSLPEVSDASATLEPLLQKGDALYVVGGPVEGSGYRWYQVFAPRAGLGGWVALAEKNGAPWIEARPLRCTIGASDDVLVGEIGYELMHLACFKGQAFGGERILAAVSDDGLRCPDVMSYWLEPGWLNSWVRCTYEFGPRDPATGVFDLVSGGTFHPSIGGTAGELLDASANPTLGVLVDVVGQIDHPDSRRCTAVGDEPPPPVQATLECRSIFVITEIRRANPMPVPQLAANGIEDYTGSDGNPYTRYRLTITNWTAYASELFSAAPDLPACGLSTSASRTWVYIYRAADSSYMYGFCGLAAPNDLTQLWFGLPRGVAPPSGVYVTLTDRQSGEIVTSNTVGFTS